MYILLLYNFPGHRYVPITPNGSTPILVGGDRLTEANSRNIQWAFANGGSIKDRLEDLQFMFLDWHAVRNLYEVSVRQLGHSIEDMRVTSS